MIREVKIYGNPVLREKSQLVEKVDRDIKQLVNDMFETMYAMEGIGLAAPQIGISLCILVIDLQQGDCSKIALINPEVHMEGALTHFVEGCLSVPGITADVIRPEFVKVSGLDLDGKKHQIETDGLLARAMQHETDHLEGILFVDRLKPVRLSLLKGKLRRLAKDNQAGRISFTHEKSDSLL